MDFAEFEKKAKCLYCERPINKYQAAYVSGCVYKCECSLSSRMKYKDGYIFNLPVSNKYEFKIDTCKSFFQVILIADALLLGKRDNRTILETDVLPDFLLLPRLKLLTKLDEYLTWI